MFDIASDPSDVRLLCHEFLLSAAKNRESSEEALASFDSRKILHSELLDQRRSHSRSTQQICELQQVRTTVIYITYYCSSHHTSRNRGQIMPSIS